MRKKIKHLKDKFQTSMEEVAKIMGISPSEITREDYVRISVDCGLQDKLNKEELNIIGGFREAKDVFFPPMLTTAPQIKILVFDIETLPILSYTWGLFDQNIGLNQIVEDWSVLSFAAKWLDSNEVIYADQRNSKNIRDDKNLLKKIWKLLDEADVIIGQNSKQFDIKKLNARFIQHGMKPPSSFKHIDTLQIAKKKFGFTSNKLAYMTDILCTKYKKSEHRKYSGFELWRQCMAKNMDAFKEMEEYNKLDVLSLQELYEKLAAWDNDFNPNMYHNSQETICQCGNKTFHDSGFHYTVAGKYKKYQCTQCGHEIRDTENLLKKGKRKSLKRNIK